jgi:hypothetical protein
MIMKKEYMKPFIRMIEAETEDMIALSIDNNTTADPNEEVLSREDDSWIVGRGVWEEEE